MRKTKGLPRLTLDSLRSKLQINSWPIAIQIAIDNSSSENEYLASAAYEKLADDVARYERDNAATKISPVSVSESAAKQPPRIRQHLYCFMFNRSRASIAIGTCYESTVEHKQRMSFPYLYIHAASFGEANTKALRVNDTLRLLAVEPDDCETAVITTLQSVLQNVNGFLHSDEMEHLPTPPLKNIQAIRRKRSKKSPAKHTQLSTIVNHETTKRRLPFAPTELERCKRMHQPIVYVTPPPISTIGPFDDGIRIHKLAKDLAAAAASELGLAPLLFEE